MICFTLRALIQKMAGFEERGWPVDVSENLTDLTEFGPTPTPPHPTRLLAS
jgi:hypothetical protein